jgi:hypothetical protein
VISDDFFLDFASLPGREKGTRDLFFYVLIPFWQKTCGIKPKLFGTSGVFTDIMVSVLVEYDPNVPEIFSKNAYIMECLRAS